MLTKMDELYLNRNTLEFVDLHSLDQLRYLYLYQELRQILTKIFALLKVSCRLKQLWKFAYQLSFFAPGLIA